MPQEKDPTLPNMRKERETKVDGRYIIFYTFEEDAEEEREEGAG